MKVSALVGGVQYLQLVEKWMSVTTRIIFLSVEDDWQGMDTLGNCFFFFFFFILACFVFCLWSVQVPMKNEIKNISTGLEETQ